MTSAVPGMQVLCDILGAGCAFETLVKAAHVLKPHAPPKSRNNKPRQARRPLGYMPDMRKPDIPLERQKVQYDNNGDIYEQFDEVVRKRRQETKRLMELNSARREEMMAKLEADREEQSQRELEQNITDLKIKDDKIMQQHLLREAREEDRKKRMARLKSPNLKKNVPLHIAMEERYQQEVVLPAMEQQRAMLRKVREKFESPLKDIAEHESSYLARNREREEQHRQEIRSQLKEHNRHLKNWKCKKFDDFLDSERKKKEEQEQERVHKQEMKDKRLKYAKQVQGPLPPLKPKPPAEAQTEVPDGRRRQMGNDYMRAAKQCISKKSTSAESQMPEDAEKYYSTRSKGNEYMRVAKQLVARDASGCIARKENKEESSPVELNPLRNKVRRLDRVFNEPILAESASNDPRLLLQQQQQALEAVAAMKAKLDLLQQLS